MRRILRYTAIFGILLLVLGGGAAWWAYEAVHQVRPFYQQAMAVQPSVLREAGQELSSRATALVNDICRNEPWQATFSEAQINGWLAFDLPEKHGDLLPEEVVDPRVAIVENQLIIGVRYTGGRVETVLSVDVEPYLSAPNVLGLKILGARAGTLPVPLNEVTERLTRAAERFGIPLSWIQESESPTALVTLKLRSQESGRRLRLQELSLRKGAVLLGGVAASHQQEEAIPPEAAQLEGQESERGEKAADERISN